MAATAVRVEIFLQARDGARVLVQSVRACAHAWLRSFGCLVLKRQELMHAILELVDWRLASQSNYACERRRRIGLRIIWLTLRQDTDARRRRLNLPRGGRRL